VFNTKDKTAIYFDKVSLRKTKDGVKVARMRIAVPMTVEVALKCPSEIRAAWEAIETLENKISYVELDKIIAGVNVEFYVLPDSRSISLALPSAQLERLVVERVESKENVGTRLLFSIEIFIESEDKLRHWIVDNVFNQLWAKFEIQQMTLMPSLEEPKKADANKEHCPFPGCTRAPEHDGEHDDGKPTVM
jgi:hypothetical protein